jgi:site-specific DNA-methyltransferase (adenine-specific)
MQGDCLERMKEIESASVDLTVTSPPYDNLRSYNGGVSQWGERVWRNVLKELFRVTKNGGVVVWVVGDATVKGSETGTSFKQALWAIECGFNLHDTMIYEKAQACFGSNKCYLQSFEYMFVFSKGSPKSINHIRDRLNVRGGVDESTVSRGMDMHGKSGVRVNKKAEIYGKRKNIWKYGVGGGNTGHPAVFPERLANDHIISWSNDGDVVLDPFMGSGTTGVACVNLNRNFIGIELDEGYFKIAQDRIGQAELLNSSDHTQPKTAP